MVVGTIFAVSCPLDVVPGFAFRLLHGISKQGSCRARIVEKATKKAASSHINKTALNPPFSSKEN